MMRNPTHLAHPRQTKVALFCSMLFLALFAGFPTVTARPPPDVEWRFQCGSRIYSSGVVADVSPSPGLEILVASSAERKVYCLTATGKVLWTYEGFTLRVTSTPTVADLDADGKPEILIATRENGVVCLDADGTLRWQSPVESGIPWGSPTVADADRDGVREIYWISLAGARRLNRQLGQICRVAE